MSKPAPGASSLVSYPKAFYNTIERRDGFGFGGFFLGGGDGGGVFSLLILK